MGFSVAGITLLATLYASASYIAAPAAMRIAIPEANPGLSIGAALGVTFPFNLLLEIPAYHWLAGLAHGVSSGASRTARSRPLTVVCEAKLERLVPQDVLRLGARGHTLSDARGGGARGVRRSLVLERQHSPGGAL